MSTMEQSSPARRLALGDLENELGTTRRVLERLSDEHLGWKPHAKSMSLGELAAHVANLVAWQVVTVEQSELDLAAAPPPIGGATSRDEVLKTFDENVVALKRAVAGMDDAALGEKWTLRNGEHVVLNLPRAAVMRTMGISHIVHHRGQLSVYLRMLDVPVPAIYGPSADERPAF